MSLRVRNLGKAQTGLIFGQSLLSSHYVSVGDVSFSWISSLGSVPGLVFQTLFHPHLERFRVPSMQSWASYTSYFVLGFWEVGCKTCQLRSLSGPGTDSLVANTVPSPSRCKDEKKQFPHHHRGITTQINI